MDGLWLHLIPASDHRVAGSSPAGCKMIIGKHLLISFDLKTGWHFWVSSSFHPHFSCSQSVNFLAGSYGWATRSTRICEPFFSKTVTRSRNARDLGPPILTLDQAGKRTRPREANRNRSAWKEGWAPAGPDRRANLAGASMPSSRPLEPVPEARTLTRASGVSKMTPKTKAKKTRKSLGTKNWRKNGAVRDGRITSCHRPARGEAKRNGIRLGSER
jgi:hypothetical protein